MVLGNDFAGTVASIGAKVSTAQARSSGLRLEADLAHGTHAKHILVKAAHVLRRARRRRSSGARRDPLQLRHHVAGGARRGLTRRNAAGKRVLVHGAAGGLGTLALQMLSAWGANITAIARPATWAECLRAGATEIVDADKQPFASLGRTFDATLNFATWDDDLALVRCLRDGALGHATTVHPMLGNLDRYGWVRGGLKSFSEKKSHRAALPKGTKILHMDPFSARCGSACGSRSTRRAPTS